MRAMREIRGGVIHAPLSRCPPLEGGGAPEPHDRRDLEGVGVGEENDWL